MSDDAPLTFSDLSKLSVQVLAGVGTETTRKLADFGIGSVLDLLFHYPSRWIDRSNEARIRDLVEDQQVLVIGQVESVSSRTTRTRKPLVTARISDGTGRLTLTFFNQYWQAKRLTEAKDSENEVTAFGKVGRYRGALQMTNPVVDVLGKPNGRRQTGRIVPVYRQSEKHEIDTRDFADWTGNALSRCARRTLADPVPAGVLAARGLVDRHTAFVGIHQPESLEGLEAARRRLAFDEVFRIQVMLVGRKRLLERNSRAFVHRTDGPLLERFLGSLPYPLTGAQRRVIDEIAADLASPRPMHRLLQGDVGSGKTVVATWTMLAAVQGGHQAALMAPTEVLAEQHHRVISTMLDGVSVPDGDNLFGDRPLRVEILTNSVTGERRRSILAGLADGSVDVVIGTQALIQDKVSFDDLGVVVVDEQHRFGVEQRAALGGRDSIVDGDAPVPDVLTMTATPIPRTVAMTVYGDLDVSVIDEMPPGRTPIETAWVGPGLFVEEMWGQVRETVERGEQVYVVCPLVGDSDKMQAASAESTHAELENGELHGLKVGLVHGQMHSRDKDAAMTKFRTGETEVLVSTTVIEVGVDVPNATVMVVLDADRFGIAQLHQLRGRVGRGTKASKCFLVTGGDAPTARVGALVASTDGFHLASVDLALRGEGTVLGEAQSGHRGLKLASLTRDLDLIQSAREAAFATVDSDPDLADNSVLREELRLLFTTEEEEFLFKG